MCPHCNWIGSQPQSNSNPYVIDREYCLSRLVILDVSLSGAHRSAAKHKQIGRGKPGAQGPGRSPVSVTVFCVSGTGESIVELEGTTLCVNVTPSGFTSTTR